MDKRENQKSEEIKEIEKGTIVENNTSTEDGVEDKEDSYKNNDFSVKISKYLDKVRKNLHNLTDNIHKKLQELQNTNVNKTEETPVTNTDNEDNNEFGKKKKPNKIVIGVLVGLVIVMLAVASMFSGDTYKEGSLSYNEFMTEVRNGNIEYVVRDSTTPLIQVVYKEGVCQEDDYDEKTGELVEHLIVDNHRIETVINPEDDNFYKVISEYDVIIKIKDTTATTVLAVVVGYIPSFLLIAILIGYMYSMTSGNLGKKKKVSNVKSEIRFSDVAGMTEEKEELLFAIESLKNHEEYVEKGVKPVRGILLEGPPGVGKTLLAKAVAGEAGVNFLSYSGADFVEMFVGLGARRVRNMYEEAEKQKPCVVFIDEIDALGRSRVSGNGGGSNSEADQTLIALLERMDGMNTASGILFIGATNRVDMLDSALLRPGRFDKTIHIGPPKTKEDREAIVRVHSRDKHFEDGLTVERVAKQCYGLTGAEIAAALNDAVLESFKADREGIISIEDVDKAIMKLFARGLAKGRHSEKDLHRVAIHEVGHAMMNKELGRDVVKVSIQPYSSGVGGVTVVDGETSGMDGLRTKTDLENDIKVLYAGKVAEETMLGECSVGASNDIERATQILRDYIGAYGMKSGNYLSLMGLAKENMMITANETLLEEMNNVANIIYDEVYSFFEDDKVKKRLQKIADELVETEVIYGIEKFYDVEDTEDMSEKISVKEDKKNVKTYVSLKDGKLKK